MRKLFRAIAGCFSAHPSERFPAILDEVTPARVSTICIPASSVLVNPRLPRTGARSVVRSKGLFVAVRATFEDFGSCLHYDHLAFSPVLSDISRIGFSRHISQKTVSAWRDRLHPDRDPFFLARKGGGTNVLKSPSSFSLPSAFSSSQTTASFPQGSNHHLAF
jgi:hypothetical protein